MSYEQLIADLSKLLSQFKEHLIALTPKLIGAITIMLIGLLIARLFKKMINRFIKNLDRIIPNKKLQTRIKQLRLERSASLVSKILYWIIIVFFLVIATEILNIPIVTTWLSNLLHYLPNILIAAIIVLLGFTGGRLLRDIITNMVARAGLLHGNVLGMFAQYITFLIAILISVNQIGINITILTGMIDIVLAAILFGAALAFGMGARASVSNIISSYYLQSRYRQGQTVKIGDIKGRITQITSTMVILDTSEGQVSVPAKKFSEISSTLLNKEGSTI